MRYLHIRSGRVVNVVEYPDTPPDTEDGADIVPAVTGAEAPGDLFDATDAVKTREVAKLEGVNLLIFQEMFRLTNEVRALR
jgi:hypothetical protein